MPVRVVCKPDARGCSLWRYLLERPDSRAGIPGSRPVRNKNELGRCGPVSGGVTYVCMYVCNT